MPVLRRADGIPFALRSYRESLTLKSGSLLRRELYLLSQSHGQYARFLKQGEGRLEAIFSKDEGYLLGETVWQHFGLPENLIYCERLADEQDILTVIVFAGSVYLDAKLSYEDLMEEFTTLFSSNVKYHIFVAGNVPLTNGKANDKFSFPEEIVESFQHLPEGVFDNLPVLPQFQLLRFEKAVEELRLGEALKRAFVAAAATLIGLIWLWHWLGTEPAPTQKVAIDPLEKYAAEFANPDPAQQLADLANDMISIQSLPGWVPIAIDYNAAGARVKVRTLGSPTELLLTWAEQNGGAVNFTYDGAMLLLPSKLKNRTQVPSLTSLTKTLSIIIDGMMKIIPGKSVTIVNFNNQMTYNANVLTIGIKNASPIILTLIGKVLNGLPVALTSSTFTLNNGLLSGTIQLTVLGN